MRHARGQRAHRGHPVRQQQPRLHLLALGEVREHGHHVRRARVLGDARVDEHVAQLPALGPHARLHPAQHALLPEDGAQPIRLDGRLPQVQVLRRAPEHLLARVAEQPRAGLVHLDEGIALARGDAGGHRALPQQHRAQPVQLEVVRHRRRPSRPTGARRAATAPGPRPRPAAAAGSRPPRRPAAVAASPPARRAPPARSPPASHAGRPGAHARGRSGLPLHPCPAAPGGRATAGRPRWPLRHPRPGSASHRADGAGAPRGRDRCSQMERAGLACAPQRGGGGVQTTSYYGQVLPRWGWLPHRRRGGTGIPWMSGIERIPQRLRGSRGGPGGAFYWRYDLGADMRAKAALA